MSAEPPVGVDANGYVVTVGAAPVQPEFEPLLADVLATLSQSAFGLDGIYLYGSVARGDATAEVSDLDLTLVLSDPPQAAVLEQLERARLALEQRHPCVTKVDFDIGHRAQVLAPQNHNRWGFWLKHHCRCLWGDDLGLRFEPFRPSRDIALALNDDFVEVLSRYRADIVQAANTPQRLRLQREAARKLIRSTHTLRSAEATMWPQTLEEHVALFRQRYPTMITQIAYFLFEARNPSAEGEAFLLRLDAFIDWMVSQSA
ncbi:nucleotidyltransferase domain-containing protein [Pseudomonas sp. R2-60-08W]|uniref:nucleotidyltransferase domain-containing protein n=1 Tax=Pseudomonas sp. R2-60-08W TaxID=1173280 RepID=UPI000F566680|nr:nucleotidyltransferase domain-containing protein [Pseudomonas sp. R2-60-08W]AZF27104.1 putative nucleotidyltransferase [Pseudomonas sp. R2-60-08W]